MILATRGILEAKDTSAWSVLIMISAHHVMKMEPGAQDTHWIILCSVSLLEVILVCVFNEFLLKDTISIISLINAA